MLRVISSLLLLGFSALALAENKAEVLETATVEVVGTTPLASIGLPIDQVPSNVQVAKGEDIQAQQGLGITDFMAQNLQGVNINEAQNNPYQPDVNFRGFTASPLLGTPQGLSVYQDGVRINEPFGDTVNWDLIPQNAISGITLMPGSNPLFGLNTLGGALSVQTKSGEHYPGGGVQLYGGSWGRRAVEGEYGGKSDNGFSWFFAGNKFREDGWRDASPSDVLQGFGKLGWSNDKTDVDISFTAADTDLIGNGFQSQTLMDTFGYESIYTKPDNTKNTLGFINGKVTHWLSDELLVSSNLYYRHQRNSTFNGDANDLYEGLYETCNDPGGLNLGAVCETLYDHGVVNRTSTQNKGYGGTLQLSWANEANLMVAGATIDIGRTTFRQSEQGSEDGDDVRFDAERGLTNVDGDIELVNDISGHTTTWSMFITDTFSVSPKLAVTGSLRYNHTHIKLTDRLAGQKEGTCINDLTGLVDDCDNPGVTEVEAAPDPLGAAKDSPYTYTRLNPAIGLTYSFVPELNMYAGYNEGSRAPSPIENGCSDPNFPCLLPNAMAGDPPLKQVVARTFEGGVRGKLANNVRWTVGAYRTTNSNDLQFIASGTTGAGYFDNVGKTRRQGVDLGLSGEIGNFRWSAGYSYVSATYEDSFELASEANSTRDSFNCDGSAAADDVICVRKGDKLPGIPEHQLKLRAEWRAMPNWTIGTSAVMFSDQYARGNENNRHQADNVTYFGSGKVGGYGVLNLDTRYKFATSGWQLFAKVNNVFDRKYYTAGLLGENSFVAAGSTFATDAESKKELFLAPGAPRAAWIGLRYDFGGAKTTANKDND
jgi:outer membrane receptor protein involved in Fe transport